MADTMHAITEKSCSRCRRVLPASDFKPESRYKNGLHSWCRDCLSASSKDYYARNKDKWRTRYEDNKRDILARKHQKYWADPERGRAASNDVHRRLKIDVISRYGGVCQCCSETNLGFLTIDHIDGCGKDLRKEHGLGSKFYYWLRRNGYPEGFQVLCFNCNLGRAINGGACPHGYI